MKKCYRCKSQLCNTVEVKDDKCPCCKREHK